MITKLPQSIETYFQAANSHENSLLADCFTEDAVVHDEGKDYHGLAAIKKWNEASSKEYDFTLELISAVEEGGQTIVTTQASGNFPGSPTAIKFHFTIKDQKITSLSCG
ncbi:nuclear transport factor 2 family protein [Sporosarcina sp. FSL K6-5500]|uniref:nuclear transport factor 2 family protein n=1 Tax=Sporosarcina sp. FSL K6-5500 TaxID=2921558 RepID=UPI0030FB543F